MFKRGNLLLSIIIMGVTVLAGSVVSCKTQDDNPDLDTGDILFAASKPGVGGLDEAIVDVSQTDMETSYSHMGIVEREGDSIFVIHAEPRKGVCREPLDDFLPEYYSVDAFRLNEEYLEYIPDAIAYARSLVGEPYDYSYIIGSEGHYCSGLIYYIFEDNEVFELTPMTFIDPETGEFHDRWIKHYKELGIDIPEGVPGCSPNGMANSGKLNFLAKVK